MLDVGIIGLGPDWEPRYRPALKKLQRRIRVRALFDPVSNRAQAAAAEFAIHPSLGMLAVMQQADVEALLMLDRAWHGHISLDFAKLSAKPVYIAGSFTQSTDALRFLAEFHEDNGIPFVPEFSRRYSPVATRTMELIATRLGRPHRIQLHTGLSSGLPGDNGAGLDADLLAGMIDLCQYLVGTVPRRIHDRPAPSGNSVARIVEVEFAESVGGGPPAAAQVFFHHGDDPAHVRCDIECLHGGARWAGGHEIEWRDAERTVTECLDADRSDVEVMLDHFCRRAVGGLIPVPGLDDVRNALAVLQAAADSRNTGQPRHL